MDGNEEVVELTAPARERVGLVRPLVLATLIAAAYFVAAQVGYAFAIPQGTVTLWPPAGVMLGVFLLTERRDWPAIIAGGFVGSATSDVFTGYAIGPAVLGAVVNCLESLLAAWLVTRRLGAPVRLSNLRSAVVLTGIAVVFSNALTACLGAVLVHVVLHAPLASAWFNWWVGGGLGMLAVAPAMLAWADVAERRPAVRRVKVLEAVILVLGLSLVSHIAFGSLPDWLIQPGPYAVFPFLLWAALRFGPAGATAASLVVAAYSIWNAALGVGPFAAPLGSGADVALQVYAFLTSAILCALIPAVILEEQKRAARSLSESEDRYRTVVETATDAIITVDASSRILFANTAVERVFGYTPREVVGQELAMLMLPGLRAGDGPGIEGYLAGGEARIGWRGALLTGVHKDGREVPLEVSFGEVADKKSHVFTGVLRDISEKRRAEHALSAAQEQMRFAMETSRVGTWQVDLQTGVCLWSPMLEALHGLSPGSFGGTFDAFFELVHPEDRESVRSAIETSTRQRTDTHTLYRTTWPDGSVHWMNGIGRTSYDAAGNPLRAAGIELDVTERRGLEEQIRQSQKMDAVGQLAGGIAHDFNNLLTAIQGFCGLLSDSLAPDSPQRADVDEIFRASERAASLTRQLLSFSRRQILAPRVLDLGQSVTAMEPMLGRLIGEHIELVVRIPADLGRVRADPTHMEQIILNLALNAADAMPERGTLVLALTNVELGEADERFHIDVARGPYVMLAVSDSGVGMDAATVSRVFEPFFTTKGVGKGTGLGLATVHGIVKQSGGTIWLYSEPGQGTTFKVYLPRVDEPVTTGDQVRATDVLASAGSETILVCEDDEVVRRLVSRFLKRRGYDVIVAATPLEAIAASEHPVHPIKLLLTDVVLPEMSGRALAERITAIHPHIRVLYMSGYTDDAVVRRGVLDSDTQFIQKPFEASALVDKVREVLDRAVPVS